MSWAALFVCLLKPWSLSGIIMPNPTISTNTPSLQNDITLLTQTVTSLQSTTGQLKTDLLAAKSDLSVKEQVFNLSKNLESKTRDVAFEASLLEGEQTTYTPLPFSKILYNSGDGYNLTSGTFTAPVSGTYMFWAQIENIEPNTYMNIWIMKTGRDDILSSGWVATDTTISDAVANAQTVQHLNTGEEVWVEITVEHTLKDSDASYFGGVLLSVH
ncbi:uncharacterized protein [Haliotis asinina]|uniref:uncharacterized protein n=1 Tax=Haliotis asinina TaxID=109174 RepID=UPI0035320F24